MDVDINELQEKYQKYSPEEILTDALNRFPGRIALGSSLGAEDQVITDMLTRIDPSPRIFFLDTGRHYPETYATITATMERYGVHYEIFFPTAAAVEKLVQSRGPDLFYHSLEERKACCHIRKVEPLQRALLSVDAWITGLRREQSVTRSTVELIGWDQSNQRIKLNPLANWTTEQVWQYIREYQVPYHPLHDQNYPSIGCAPCTRAVQPGEDLRAGRWWWEIPEHKECGLHYRDGKLVRAT